MKDRVYQPYKQSLVTLARENRKCSTPAEQKIWRAMLRKRQMMGFKFLRQKPIDGYIVDFYCAELGLVLEVDGDSHTAREAYDAERTRVLNAYGLQVLRYTNHAILHNIAAVHQHLSEYIMCLQQRSASSSSPDKGRSGGVSST